MHPKPDRAKVAHWNAILRPYIGADTRRSVVQLTVTVLGFVGCWYLAWRALEFGWWATIVMALPATGFLMRLFMIQHDCGHGSYFRSRAARDWVGRAIGVLLLTPYDYWRKTHAWHHAHSGDLDFRGFGDIDTLTVAEYRALSRAGRIGYRIYRNPLVLLTVGPIYHFVVKHRFPWDIPRDWTAAWKSVWWTNVALVAVVAGMSLWIGWLPFVMVQGPITAFACALGVALFYVQHQFENTYWHDHEAWDYYDASLHGSSHLKLPAPLQWITASIGVHHVHHMSARIPNYRLQEAHDENPEFHVAQTITMRDAVRLFRLALWDEDSERLIRFGELKHLLAPSPRPAEVGHGR